VRGYTGLFPDEDPAYGPVIDDPIPVVIPPPNGSQLTFEQYANLTGQEQLDWWSAGGTLKV